VLALLIQSQLVLEVLGLGQQEMTEVIPYSAPLHLREEVQVVVQIRVVTLYQQELEVLVAEEVIPVTKQVQMETLLQ
tara:strand:+ start:646 stop:876 length:231 start_codon:yes stop_codon:yes gene_type:complete